MSAKLLSQLKNLPKTDVNSDWLNYIQLFGSKEVNKTHLKQILNDSDLTKVKYVGMSNEMIPLHAWRYLTQIGTTEDHNFIIELLIKDEYLEAMCFHSDFTRIANYFNIDSFKTIKKHMSNPNTKDYIKLCFINALVPFFKKFKNLRQEVVLLIKGYFEENNTMQDADVSYVLKMLVKFNTYDFDEILIELDDKGIINLNNVSNDILDELISE